MIAQSSRLVFRVESDLEDYLEVHLSSLLLRFGLDLLIIGRQFKTRFDGRVDLLAIDASGVIYIIELKVAEAKPEIVAQVLGYLHWIKQLSREEIIRDVAAGRLKVDLMDAFQRHFGHPLPNAVNNSQVLVFIAGSIHPTTAGGILALKGLGCTITTLRYIIQHESVSFIPCCRNDHDAEALQAEKRQSARLRLAAAAMANRSSTYKVRIDEDIRRFWLTQAEHFPSLVRFKFVYVRYKHWIHTQAADGMHLSRCLEGDVARQLTAITAESNEWVHVFVARGSNLNAHETSMNPPSVRARRDFHHTISAYQRNTADKDGPESARRS